MKFLALGSELLPSDPQQQAEIEGWVAAAWADVWSLSEEWLGQTWGQREVNPEALKYARQELTNLLGLLESRLVSTGGYVVGGSLSLADIAWFSALLYAFKLLIDPGMQKKFVKVVTWFRNIALHPQVREVVGAV